MSSMSNVARDAAKDARDATKEATKAAAAGANDIQEDLQVLRDDVTRLTRQIAGILSSKGTQAWERARSNVDGVVADAQERGMDAVDAAREMGETVVDTIDESVRQRPYTMLALAAGLGFLCGATWRR